MGHRWLADKKLPAEAMEVGGVQHWDPFAKQMRERKRERERDKKIMFVGRDRSWSLFFSFLFLS